MTTQSIQEELTATLRHVLFQPLCTDDPTMIMQRIEQNQSTKKLSKLIAKYGLPCVTNTAKQLVHQAHADEARRQRTDRSLSVRSDSQLRTSSIVADGRTDGTSVTSPESGQGQQSHIEHVTNISDGSSRMPLFIQHMVMVDVQALLEEVCYAHTVKHIPDLLAEQRWTCAEAVEINKWLITAGALPNVRQLFGKKQAGMTVNKLFETLVQARHATVHRVDQTIAEIEKILVAANLFTRIIGDDAQQQRLAHLARRWNSATDQRQELAEQEASLAAQFNASRLDCIERSKLEIIQLWYEQHRQQQVLRQQVKEMLEPKCVAPVASRGPLKLYESVQANFCQYAGTLMTVTLFMYEQSRRMMGRTE